MFSIENINVHDSLFDLKTRKRILIVDDDVEMIRYYKIKFRGATNFFVSHAMNGYEGALKAESDQPDLIIMDLEMPYCDGKKAIDIIKSSDRTQYIPILCLSSKVKTGQYIWGVDRVLNKRESSEMILNEVKKLL